MKYNTTAFKERYNRWKNGENYWDIVGSPLPSYKKGTPSKFLYSTVGKNSKIVDDTIDHLLDMGLDPIQVAGIAGNISQESMFNPNAVDSTGYRGLVQMSPSMRKEVIRAYGKFNPTTQRRFINDVITGADTVGKEWRNYGTQMGGYMGKFESPEAAAVQFGRVFERPKESKANWSERKRSARDAYEYINNRIANRRRQQFQQNIINAPKLKPVLDSMVENEPYIYETQKNVPEYLQRQNSPNRNFSNSQQYTILPSLQETMMNVLQDKPIINIPQSTVIGNGYTLSNNK